MDRQLNYPTFLYDDIEIKLRSWESFEVVKFYEPIRPIDLICFSNLCLCFTYHRVKYHGTRLHIQPIRLTVTTALPL